MSNRSRIVESVDDRIRKDLVFMNNPVLIDGLALAPVIAAAITTKNAVILSIAAAIILIPTRFIGNLLIGIVPQRLRMMFYSLIASLLFVPALMVIVDVFAFDITIVGLYFPIIVVDGIVLSRCEIPSREKVGESFLNGIKTAIGFAIVIISVGFIRELLVYNEIWGRKISFSFKLGIFGTTAGGFILLALMCATTQWIVSALKRRIYSGVKKDAE